MLFNSYEFLFLYLPLVWMGFYLLMRANLQHLTRGFLFLSSLFFYAYWDFRLLPLLLLSICFNYVAGKSLIARKSKPLLIFALGVNLSALFFFKYFSFFLSTVNVSVPEIILPLGISFFTFTQIAFLVDAYRSLAEKSDPFSYGLFVTIFPHLIAGPILHHSSMMSQFKTKLFQFETVNLQTGISFFILGLCKKTLIADHLSHMVTNIFDSDAYTLGVLNSWIATLAYTFQLYYDFSGYSDMALGLGKMFNLDLPINFDSPYKASSVIEFWKRWHISLSQFLRDYLYIPLGGNRFGKTKQLRNLFLTMLLGGVWHGAGFTYIIWGALHGLYLVINHIWKNLGAKLPPTLGWGLTFVSVAIGWVFFRAPTLSKAAQVISAMFGKAHLGTEEFFPSAYQLITFGLIALSTLFLPNSRALIERFQPRTSWAVSLGIALALALISFDKTSEFLYFQF